MFVGFDGLHSPCSLRFLFISYFFRNPKSVFHVQTLPPVVPLSPCLPPSHRFPKTRPALFSFLTVGGVTAFLVVLVVTGDVVVSFIVVSVVVRRSMIVGRMELFCDGMLDLSNTCRSYPLHRSLFIHHDACRAQPSCMATLWLLLYFYVSCVFPRLGCVFY